MTEIREEPAMHRTEGVADRPIAWNAPRPMVGKGSARRQTEPSRLSEALFEQAHAPMVVIGADGVVALANAGFRALSGCIERELVGRAFVHAFTPAYRDRVAAMLARIAEEPSPHERMQVAFANGRVCHLECFGRADIDETGASLWTFSDVTHREQREQAIERYEIFSRHAHDIVLFIAPDGRLLEANDAAVSAYGYTREELLRLRIEDLRLPTTRQIVAEQMEEAFTRGVLIETMHIRKDGSQFPVEVGARAAMIGGERILLSIIRDISRRSELQAKLIQADRMAALGTMAAGIAHEVNNPLAYTMVNLQMARRRLGQLAHSLGGIEPSHASVDDMAAEIETLRAMLDLAHEGTERVRLIVDDLRAFSRHDDIAADPIELVPLVEAAIEIATNEIRNRAKLVRTYEPVALVRGSPSRLTQVFLNLLINAAQAIPEGDEGHNEIRVTTSTNAAGEAQVEIRDTGRGISPELQDRIFDAFFTTKPLDEGTGLGLFISRSIVTGHGGDITAENAPDRGTIFRITLPAAKVESG